MRKSKNNAAYPSRKRHYQNRITHCSSKKKNLLFFRTSHSRSRGGSAGETVSSELCGVGGLCKDPRESHNRNSTTDPTLQASKTHSLLSPLPHGQTYEKKDELCGGNMENPLAKTTRPGPRARAERSGRGASLLLQTGFSGVIGWRHLVAPRACTSLQR